MKTKVLLTVIMSTIMFNALGQKSDINLTFTAVDSADYVQLDSIKIMNRTQGGDTVLYYPDTVLSLYFVGIPEIDKKDNLFYVFQNYPNPVMDQTTISLFIPEKDKVSIVITDLLGRVIIKSDRVLDKGTHSFRFIPGNKGIYFYTAKWRGQSSSIKILSVVSNSFNMSSFEYQDSKTSSSHSQMKSIQDIQNFLFNFGDTLLYIGYTDTLQSGILDTPEENQTYTFHFATNIPCVGTHTVEYDGQVYKTIQIFSQCWLKENLNVGWMIPGCGDMKDNGFIEKYCYNNEPDSCDKYGGLYQWDETVQYATQQGSRGICPPGWHVPTDEEWKVLEGAVDSQYGIGDPEWDISAPYWRGYDAGMNLKSTSGWYYGGYGKDLYGFSGLPGGSREYDGTFDYLLIRGVWWTSTKYDVSDGWTRMMDNIYSILDRDTYGGNRRGISVRCIRDESFFKIVLKFTAIRNESYVPLDSIKIINCTQGLEKMLYMPDSSVILPWELPFDIGDELLYIGYTDTLESGIPDSPEESKIYTFQFATNIPCIGIPTVEYEGQVYNTVQIFNQCWLKENLNVGTMIEGNKNMKDNGIIEKYCYDNEPDSCEKYGGLYQWGEMMQYTNQQGAQGICPPGWHLPTDYEWKLLEGAVDSKYYIDDSEWDNCYYRGYDVGLNLKSSNGWIFGGNGTDLYGFSALPGSNRSIDGNFSYIGVLGIWWTSSRFNNHYAMFRLFDSYNIRSYRDFMLKGIGNGVRCLKDN